MRDTKHAVEKEIQWFGMRTKTPKSVHKRLSLVQINAFKSYVHNHPHLDKVPGLDMTPAELARVCSSRYLSDLHLTWVASKLNQQQTDSFVVFMNFVSDIDRFCERTLLSRPNVPKKLVFMINVGMGREKKTYLGSDSVRGSHWTLSVFDSTDDSFVYGDSLGWPPPDALIEKINCYTEKV